MPCFYTHYRFSQDVLNRLSDNNKKIINERPIYYEIFNQSFDNLYFHHTFNIKKDIKIWKLSNYAHKHQANNYFKHIINYIIDNNLQKNPEVIGYLYGSINHYILDLTIHPYVYYKTGFFRRKNIHTYKYEGQHSKFEYMLDAYFYEKDTGLKIFKYKLYNERIPKVRFSHNLLNCIDYTFLKTFKTKNMGKEFQKSYLQEHRIYRNYFYDKYGIKKLFYYLVDFITPLKGFKCKYLSYHVDNVDEGILNENNDLWENPCDNNIKSNQSVLELYDLALNRADYLLNNLYYVLNGNYPINKFLKELGNKSYSTGLNCDNKNKMYNFEN